jgi:predicted HicB family RNase H-like nuclease
MSKETDQVKLTVRIKEALRKQLERAARRSERSLNREIIHRLKSTLERQPDEAAA